jgi:hypothetical protein
MTEGKHHMTRTRALVPGVLSLGLVIILAACGQTSDDPSPSAPAPTEAPSQPASPEPSEPPETSSPDPEAIEHELPMVGRVTADSVEVHALPSFDSPLLTGELLSDLSTVDVVLTADSEGHRHVRDRH